MKIKRKDNTIGKIYAVPKGYFTEKKEQLLETIKMEYGKDYGEKVAKEMEYQFHSPYKIKEPFFENWHLRKDDNCGMNEIDMYISEVNSQDNFIAEINSLPMPDNYSHEDDKFDIPEEYKNITSEQLRNAQKAWNDYFKQREEMRKALFGEGETNMNTKEIKIKYHNKDIEKLTYIDGKSDWIDLRAAEDVTLKAGEFKLINLGVSMKLPEGYEAHIVPRSSTFKNFGIIQTNHQAVIDNSYCGDNDIWRYPAYALKDTEIHVNDRICQFRIVENQPRIQFEEVEFLDGQDRGGIGSTGKQ